MIATKAQRYTKKYLKTFMFKSFVARWSTKCNRVCTHYKNNLCDAWCLSVFVAKYKRINDQRR